MIILKQSQSSVHTVHPKLLLVTGGPLECLVKSTLFHVACCKNNLVICKTIVSRSPGVGHLTRLGRTRFLRMVPVALNWSSVLLYSCENRSTVLLNLWLTSFIESKTISGHSTDSNITPTRSLQVSGHCARISKVCENLGYNFTHVPNHFSQKYQDDAEHEYSQFTSLIQSNCSAVLRVFLCAMYFPPCSNDCDSPTPPCRSVCRAARRDCEPLLKRSGMKWPYKFKCNNLPAPNEQACVGHDGTVISGKNNFSLYNSLIVRHAISSLLFCVITSIN